MNDKTKMLLCGGIFFALACAEVIIEKEWFYSWMILLMMGFGWYARGALAKAKSEGKK